jgi:hypothetical protein
MSFGGAGEAVAGGFGSGDDPLLVLPEVFIIIDTSGSMLWGVYKDPAGTCTDSWTSRSGDGLSCNYGHGVECVGGGKVCNSGGGYEYCSSWGASTTCYRNRVEVVKEILTGDYNSCGIGDCCVDQGDNGLLDDYAEVIRFGFATFDANSGSWYYPPGIYGFKGRNQGAGSLVDLVDPLDTSDIVANNRRVQLGACGMLAPKQGTPIGDSLKDADHYFKNWRSEIVPPYIDTVAHCRPRFVIMMTDGQNTVGSNPVAPAAALCSQGIPVLVVGFGGADLKPNLDGIAHAGSGSACSAAVLDPFMAEDPQDLKNKFKWIFDAILSGTSSRTESVSTSVNLTTDSSYMYGAYFRISETGQGWKGYLVRQKVETDAPGEWQWSAKPDDCDGDTLLCFHKELFERSWDSRKIYTVAHDPRSQECAAALDCQLPRPLHMTDPLVGLYPFSEAGNSGGTLTGPMCLGDDGYANRIIRYALGDGTETGRDGPVLGDIFHSSPVVVPPPSALTPNFRYEAHFRMNRDRYTMVYVGANDGMLHAFVAEDHKDDDGGNHEGEELWGFIPHNLLAKIQNIRSGHSFYVDGTPVVKDVFLRDTPLMDPEAPDKPLSIGGKVVKGAYRTILISGERGGGGTYFALDVTDPENPRYMWEYRTGVSVVRDYSDVQCTGGEGIQTWAKPIIGQVWVKHANPPPGEPTYTGRSVAIVPGGYMNPKLLNNARSCIEFVESLASAASLHVIDIETGKLLRRFSFATGADADNLAKLEAYYELIDQGSTAKWGETFKSDDYTGPGGWAWGSDNPGGDGWLCRESRENIQNPPQFPPELMESCVVAQDDAVKYELNCCWKDSGPVDPRDCNPNAVGACYYSYIKYKDVPGGVVIKLKGVNCEHLLSLEKAMFKLSVGESFMLESTSATPAAYNTALGEYVSRVFVPTTKGIVYRVDMAHAEYDPDADEGEMIAAYTDEGGHVYDWKVTKWWPKSPQESLGRPIQVTPTLGMSYERDLVLFFGTGIIDSLEWTDTADHLYAVKEKRTLNEDTGYYTVNDTGEWFIDKAHSKFTGFDSSERLFSNPLLVAGNLFFTTYKPNSDECLPGDAKTYGMRFDDLNDGIIFEEEKKQSSTPSAPAMLWTPTGPKIVVQRGTGVEELDLINPLEPASHIVHWGKVL